MIFRQLFEPISSTYNLSAWLRRNWTSGLVDPVINAIGRPHDLPDKLKKYCEQMGFSPQV